MPTREEVQKVLSEQIAELDKLIAAKEKERKPEGDEA